jgi:hypothetical protein
MLSHTPMHAGNVKRPMDELLANLLFDRISLMRGLNKPKGTRLEAWVEAPEWRIKR